MNSKITTAFILAAVLPACNDSGSNTGSTVSDSAEETTAPGSTTDPTDATTTAAESSTGAASNSNTAADSSSTGDGDDDGPGIYLDVGLIPDTPNHNGNCDDGKGGKGGGGGSGDPDFSFIWVSNSTEGTVSKIDTQSMVEVGRYRTRADPAGSPSRTSVNLNGDVAVANRTGGVIKILADVNQCADQDNTSSGAADVKAFPDGCVDWFTPLAYASNRPVAWTSGTFSGLTCRYENTKLWTSGANAAIDVLLLDGETGDVEQTIPIPEAQAQFYGIYGGASDADGNFWGSQLGQGHLIFVDIDNFDHQVWPMPISGYGMTVDEQGRAFTCNSGIARFDPDTQTWQSNPNVGGGGGCMTDGLGTLWIGGYAGGGAMIGVDTETLLVTETVNIPNYVHGISVDFYGYVWGVTLQQPFAYRMDPIAQTFETFNGLTGPYTYSDMTGYALSNASGLPPSG